MPGWRFWQNCHFRRICQIRQYRQLLWASSLPCALPCWQMWQNYHFRHICQICLYRQLLWAPSLLCALPCWPMCQNCHFCHICQICQYRQLLWAPSLLCALPCWRLWQNCRFCHICQIRHYVLFFAIFVVACISGHISLIHLIELKISEKNIARSKSGHKIRKIKSLRSKQDRTTPGKSCSSCHFKVESQIALSSRGNVKPR